MTIPNLFSDGFVLVANKDNAVWGESSCKKGTDLTYHIGDTHGTVVVGDGGLWMFDLKIPTTHTPMQLTISDCDQTSFVNNVKSGTLLFCSGQSNMAWSVRESDGAVLTLDRFQRASDISILRIGVIRSKRENDAFDNGIRRTRWQRGRSAAEAVSAVCLNAALELHENDPSVPIGIIDSSKGGTAIQQWMPKWAVRATKGCTKRNKKKTKVPGPPSIYYNAMLHPFKGYTISNFIWYQGESNAFFPDSYRCLGEYFFGKVLPKVFRNTDFHITTVLLAGFDGRAIFPAIRAAQRELSNAPGRSFASAIDLGDPYDIHPRNKIDVGKRVAWSILSRGIYPEVASFNKNSVVFNVPVKTRDTSGCTKCCRQGSPLQTSNDGREWTYLNDFSVDGKVVTFNGAKRFVRIMEENFVECVFSSTDQYNLPAISYIS